MTTMTPTKPTTKRPKVLIGAAVLMLLTAMLSLAAPFLPRGGGLGGAMPPGGAPMANGQAPGAGQPPADRNFVPGQNGAPGGAPGQNGAFGPAGARTGGGVGGMNFMLPLRIGEAVLGGLCALLAALGLWRLRKWGRNLALVVAVASLLSAAVTLLSPLLGRVPWLMLFTSSTWQALVGLSLALAAAVLALLPAAWGAYVVKPRERRVI